jgi:hypothetical protein
MHETEEERHPGSDIPAPLTDEQVVGPDVDDAECDGRLDQPCRRLDKLERRQRQRHAVTERESRNDRQEAPNRSSKEQQADDEKDVIRTDGDVMDT